MTATAEAVHRLIDGLPANVSDAERAALRRAITAYGMEMYRAGESRRHGERGNGHEPIHRRGD